MASRTTVLLITAAMAVVVVGALLPATTWAEEDDEGEPEDDGLYYIIVGDDDEWNLDVDYNEWAKYEKFNVGDILRFRYSTDMPNPHNVVWVDQASFDACTVGNNAITMTSGNDIMPLRDPGQYFFISSLNGDCKSGMKLAINVAP